MKPGDKVRVRDKGEDWSINELFYCYSLHGVHWVTNRKDQITPWEEIIPVDNYEFKLELKTGDRVNVRNSGGAWEPGTETYLAYYKGVYWTITDDDFTHPRKEIRLVEDYSSLLDTKGGTL